VNAAHDDEKKARGIMMLIDKPAMLSIIKILFHSS
jgi:hypothetical protein